MQCPENQAQKGAIDMFTRAISLHCSFLRSMEFIIIFIIIISSFSYSIADLISSSSSSSSSYHHLSIFHVRGRPQTLEFVASTEILLHLRRTSAEQLLPGRSQLVLKKLEHVFELRMHPLV